MSGRERNTACASGDGSERFSLNFLAATCGGSAALARPTSCVAHADLGLERDLVEKSPFRRAASSQPAPVDRVCCTHTRACHWRGVRIVRPLIDLCTPPARYGARQGLGGRLTHRGPRVLWARSPAALSRSRRPPDYCVRATPPLRVTDCLIAFRAAASLRTNGKCPSALACHISAE